MNPFKKPNQEPTDPEIMQAYEQAKKERRIENAKRIGIQDADRLVNQKPFYMKVTGALVALGKDLVQNAPNCDPNVLFNMDEPETQKRRRRKRS